MKRREEQNLKCELTEGIPSPVISAWMQARVELYEICQRIIIAIKLGQTVNSLVAFQELREHEYFPMLVLRMRISNWQKSPVKNAKMIKRTNRTILMLTEPRSFEYKHSYVEGWRYYAGQVDYIAIERSLYYARMQTDRRPPGE